MHSVTDVNLPLPPVVDRVLVRPAVLQAAIRDLARRLEAALPREEELVAVIVLDGAVPFAESLLNALRRPVESLAIRARSYFGGTASTGRVEVEGRLDGVRGRHVLLLDDIYDTGHTLHSLVTRLREAGATAITTCVLLEKKRAHEEPVGVDYVGVQVEDEFLIGFGLDYQGRYRDLPYVAVMKNA